jgi:Flp pilus assembly protein TadD
LFGTLAVVVLIGVTAAGVAWSRRGRRGGARPTVDSAIQRILTAKRIDPAEAAALVGYCVRLHRLDDAEKVANRLAAVAPNDYRAHNALGIVHGARGDTDSAEKEFTQAVALNPRGPEPYENLGRLHLHSYRFTQALAELDLATTVAPNSASAWEALGEVNQQLHRPTYAKDAFDHALKINPNFVQAHAHLGGLLANSNQSTDARPHLKRALELGSKSADLYASLAMAYADAPEQPGDLEQALQYSEEAERLGPPTPFLLYARGLAQQRLNRFQDAINTFRKVADMDRSANGAWIGLSQCYRALGDQKKADEFADIGEKMLKERQRANNLERSIEADPNRLDLRRQYAELLMNQHRYTEAAGEYSFIAEKQHDDPQEWLKAAAAHERGGNKDMAEYIRDLVRTGKHHSPPPASASNPTVH